MVFLLQCHLHCVREQPSCVIVSIVLWLSIGCLELVWFLTYHEQLWVVPV